ncbi:MAG TPA: 30S ribosomal protein S4 [Planctomycetia bacterium]|nr:30S ribosomal protein S4 [Planctomycetia bacterium]
MGRYTGPKARVNRRLGFQVFESAGAIKAFERRSNPPGMHTRRGKQSTYGIALAEKQKIKYYYGLGERQLRRYFDIASRREGNTGESLLLLCERRLDNVIRRAGLALTRPQARQGVTHRHFQVNGRTVDKPSMQLRPGDTITIRGRANLAQVYRQLVEAQRSEPLGWLSVDTESMRITVTGYPGPGDISLPVQIGLVIEFMSR